MLTSSGPHFTGGRATHKYSICAADLSTQLSVGEVSWPPTLPGGVTHFQLPAGMEGAMRHAPIHLLTIAFTDIDNAF